jgi:hypothetical protein
MFDKVGAVFQGDPSATIEALTPDNTRLRIRVFARLSDNSFGHRSFIVSGSRFEWEQSGEEWENLGGLFLSDPAANWQGDGSVRVFGRGQDNSLWVIWRTGSSWFGPERVGGEFTSAIDTVRYSTGAHVFVRGATNTILHYYYEHASSSPHNMVLHDLGGQTLGTPAAITTREGLLHIFVRGLNNGLWRKTWNGGWTDWHQIVPFITLHENSSPAVSSFLVPPSGDTKVFVFFHDSERRLRYIYFSPDETFHTALVDEREPVDINFKPDSILLFRPGELHGSLNLFATRARGEDLLHSYVAVGWEAPRFAPWTSMGGGVFSSPVTAGGYRVGGSVFVRGGDGGLYLRWWDGIRWLPA